MYDPRRPRAATKLEKPPEETEPEPPAAQQTEPEAPEEPRFAPIKADKDGGSRTGGPVIMEPNPARALDMAAPSSPPVAPPKPKRRAKPKPKPPVEASPVSEPAVEAAPVSEPVVETPYASQPAVATPEPPRAQPSRATEDTDPAVAPEVEDAINRLFASVEKPKRGRRKTTTEPAAPKPSRKAASPPPAATPVPAPTRQVEPAVPTPVPPTQQVETAVAPPIQPPPPPPETVAADDGLREIAARGEKRKRGGAGRAFLILTTVLLLGATAFLAYVLWRQTVSDRAKEQVEGVARNFISALTTYNAESIDAQSKKVMDLSVGDFREDYERLVSNPDYRKLLTDAQADSKGLIVAIAMSSFADDRAEVIAFVDVTTVNKDRPQPQVDKNRMEVSLVKTSKGWKIDNVELP